MTSTVVPRTHRIHMLKKLMFDNGPMVSCMLCIRAAISPPSPDVVTARMTRNENHKAHSRDQIPNENK